MTASAHRRARPESGVASIEFILVLFPIMIILSFSLFLARIFWDYSMAQKAAHDAVRYLATVSPADISKGPVGTEKPAAAVARKIVELETAEMNLGGFPILVDVQCDGASCGLLGPPKSVRVLIRMTLFDELFTDWTGSISGPYGLQLQADVTEPYVGN